MLTDQPNPAVRYDSRYDTGVVCEQCGNRYNPSGRRRYCTDACRQAAYRDRHLTPGPPPPNTQTRAPIVYECSTCEQRYLDTRRCPDCNLFCRRVGPGGPCPHCDEPVAHTDLRP